MCQTSRWCWWYQHGKTIWLWPRFAFPPFMWCRWWLWWCKNRKSIMLTKCNWSHWGHDQWFIIIIINDFTKPSTRCSKTFVSWSWPSSMLMKRDAYSNFLRGTKLLLSSVIKSLKYWVRSLFRVFRRRRMFAVRGNGCDLLTHTRYYSALFTLSVSDGQTNRQNDGVSISVYVTLMSLDGVRF